MTCICAQPLFQSPCCLCEAMSDLLDASVQNFKLRRPEVQIAKCGSGIYEVQGRRIKLESNGWGQPLVVDGPLRQPLSDYIDGSGRHEAWQPPLVQSALHALPKARRVSFEELYPENRTDAMRLAVLEAQAREMDAKEQLSRSPSPDRRPAMHHATVHFGHHGHHGHHGPVGSLGRTPSPLSQPNLRVPVPVLFSRSAPMVFGTAPRTLPMPLAPVARQRSHSPCPQVVKMPPAAPARMGLPELKQAFMELKGSAISLKHQLQSLQARAIEELTRSGDTTVAPPSEQADLSSSA